MVKGDLPELLGATLVELNGSGTILDVCKMFWEEHEEELRSSGDLFYTWQYDIRWAATTLRKEGIMKDASLSKTGVWELSSRGSNQ
ncbi:hypothetical protein [Adlercreutzia shanghongiae]|uniref:Restriction system protein Mrr-like N-terminal domain-containing protein n=1 Tax=Adlercreutzia shanghongiae TaxID=3111773 RepID=A0ABU6IZX1_9ACTN|nr:hypothetical protein [Adlercreutzia sp. R22]MEC4295330.1 hypothetical protein [Adlercreutzia sp. R22]